MEHAHINYSWPRKNGSADIYMCLTHYYMIYTLPIKVVYSILFHSLRGDIFKMRRQYEGHTLTLDVEFALEVSEEMSKVNMEELFFLSF